jgi:hypothetical protein
MIAIYGLYYLHQNKLKFIALILSVITFAWIAVFMVRNHPFQYVYFNYLLPHNKPEYIRKNFEMDYWGVSYRQSLEYILNHDNSKRINICAESGTPGFYNSFILPEKERIRINYVSLDKADYFITNYRYHPADYDKLKEKKFHSFTVDGNTISEIFKLK